MSNFSNKMYLYRYFKGLGADYVALGFPLCQTGDIVVILLPKKDFINIQRGHFEKMSPACVNFMKNVIHSKKSDIQYRFTFGRKELQFLAKSLGNEGLDYVCSGSRFQEILEENKVKFAHQYNRGYALEKVVYEMFGREWDWKHKGCDLIGVELNGEIVNVEIKFFNGQAKK